MSNSVRIIHVSDIHLHRGRRSWHELIPKVHRPKDNVASALLESVGQEIRSASVAGLPVVAVLSGDLSLLGKGSDIKHALEVWSVAAAGQQSVYVLGNHDFWGGSVALSFSSAGYLMHKWVSHKYWPKTPIPPIELNGARLRLYILDTTPSFVGTNLWALGDLSPGRWETLTEAMSADLNTDRGHGRDSVRMIVMHHPMLVDFWRTPIAKWWTHIDDSVLFRALPMNASRVEFFSSAGIGFVVAGHTHRWAVHGSPIAVGPTPITPEPPRYRLIQATAQSGTLAQPGYWAHTLTLADGNSTTFESRRLEFDGRMFNAVV